MKFSPTVHGEEPGVGDDEQDAQNGSEHTPHFRRKQREALRVEGENEKQHGCDGSNIKYDGDPVDHGEDAVHVQQRKNIFFAEARKFCLPTEWFIGVNGVIIRFVLLLRVENVEETDEQERSDAGGDQIADLPTLSKVRI